MQLLLLHRYMKSCATHEDTIMKFHTANLDRLEELRYRLSIWLWVKCSARRRKLCWGEVGDVRGRNVWDGHDGEVRASSTGRMKITSAFVAFLYLLSQQQTSEAILNRPKIASSVRDTWRH